MRTAQWIDFYDAEHVYVVRFLMRTGASLEDACDAAHEAFLESWAMMNRRTDEWDRIRDPRGWIRVVAVRKYLRPPGPRRRPPIAEGVPIPEVADLGPDPGELTVQTRMAMNALGRLDEQARLVMALVLDDFATRDIAAVLDVTEQRVRDVIKKARAKLKRTLARAATPEGGNHAGPRRDGAPRRADR